MPTATAPRRTRSSRSSGATSRSRTKPQTAAPVVVTTPLADQLDIDAIVAGFGPIALVLEPFVKKYRPVLEATAELVTQVVATLPEFTEKERNEIHQFQGLVTGLAARGLPPNFSMLAQLGKSLKANGAATASSETATAAPEAKPTPAAPEAAAELKPADFGRIVGVVAPFARIVAPVMSKYGEAFAVLQAAVPDDVGDMAPEALAKSIRQATPDVVFATKTALESKGSEKEKFQIWAMLVTSAVNVHTPGGIGEKLSSPLYDQDELKRFADTECEGAPPLLAFATTMTRVAAALQVQALFGEVDAFGETLKYLERQGYKIRKPVAKA